MKKIFNLLCLVVLFGALTACSDDKDDVKPLDPNTYTDQSGLQITMNGAPVIGKTAVFTPDAKDPSKATITLGSTFDLSAIPSVTLPGSQTITGPGVVPGSKELVLDVTLKAGADGMSTFSGSHSTDYCTFEYSGSVDNDFLVLDIKNLELKDKTLVGLWNPMKQVIDDDFSSDTYGQVISTPVYAVWESGSDINFLGSPMPVQNILTLVMVMPLLDDMTLTVPDALLSVLKNVEFMKDGNIVASYVDTDSEDGTAVTSPLNMAQYVVTGKNDMRFFLNPQAVIAADSKTRATRAIDLNNLLGNVMAQLVPMMGDGVPMHYALNGSELRVYLGTETLLPLLKQASPLLRDETLVASLVELVKQDESMGFIADMLPSMLTSVADAIDNTTKIEIGLNLSK